MKMMFKKLSSLLLAAALSASLTVPALAAEDDDSKIKMIIHGKMETDRCVEWVNTSGDYTETDLFADYKSVMPGAELEQTVFIENAWSAKDYIKLSMIAVLHNEDETEDEKNPISQKVLEELEGDERNEMGSELAYMHDFLHQLTLTVESDGKVIYEGHPDELAVGFEESAYEFGKIYHGDTVQLDITLTVPTDLDNTYAARIGEVDWKFIWSGYDEGGGGGGGEIIIPDPDPEPEPDVPEIIIPDPETPVEPPVQPESPKTGDDTVILPYVALFGIGLLGMILTTLGKKKQKRES